MRLKALGDAVSQNDRLAFRRVIGLKMVKCRRAIEFVAEFRAIGEDQDGWREDAQRYSREVGV